MADLKAGVVKALDALRAHFPGHDVVVMPTGDGGANVIVEAVPLGPPYHQDSTWVGFLLSSACPDDDTYPFYVTGTLSRIDGVELKGPLHVNHQFPPGVAGARSAVMVSRRQRNQSSFTNESPLRKMLTVLQWMLER